MWTKNQQTAIDAHCADNLVSAAAGSGKTAVMVERIVSKVLSGESDIDKLLVVTFTNAAASELKSRLMNKIMDSLETSDDPDRLNRQLILINNADICTIDSFCLKVLRNNFYKLGLDPGFSIADNAELELLKTDALDSLFDDLYADKDEEFTMLVESYSNKNDSELFGLIQSVYNFSCSLSGGMDELVMLAKKFDDSSIWENYYLSKAHDICKKAIGYYNRAIDACSYIEEYEKIRLMLLDEKNNFVIADNKTDWDSMCKAVSCFEFGRLTFPKGTTDADKSPVKEPREEGKALRDELNSIFSAGKEELTSDIQSASKQLNKILQITQEFVKRFSEKKLSKGVVDFNDVEHMTLRLLQDDSGNPSETARQLMNKYDEIYVDEYQDCNAVQEKLFSLISRTSIDRPNMFMVGDMKQSIYGFRGSQPNFFKAKADNYAEYCADGKFNKIVLNKNFRSRESVINAVNSIFSQIMSEDCGELSYTDDEYLYYNQGAYENVNEDTDKVDVIILETNSDLAENDTDYFEELKKTEAEAMYVANKINDILSSNYVVYDKSLGKYRKAVYSDVVILLRSGKDKAEIFNQILSSAQIPVYCDVGEGYYDTPEIAFLINFLRIIDNPLDDIALLSVMRHPVFAFNEDDFVSIRLCKTRGYFYDSIKEYQRQNSDELCSRLNSFTDILIDLYEKSKYLSTDRLLWDIVCNTDYMSYLSFLSNPDLRKANVNALMSRAYDFEKTSYKGVFDFIRYIDSLKKNNKDIEPAKTLSDDENVVRIMTIHKSKGLEFPVVFLCDAGKKFNDMDLVRDKVLIHNKLGFGLNFYDNVNKYYYELPQKKHIREVKYAQMLAEEMRILYVALTRPREKLFIVGSCRNIDIRIDKLSSMLCEEEHTLSKEVAGSAKSYLDWILLSVLRNKTVNINTVSCSTVIDDNSRFDVKIIHKDSIKLEIPKNENVRSINDMPNAYEEQIINHLSFGYPHSELADVPSNMSVTELKNMENDENIYNFYNTYKLVSPRFYDENNKFSAAEIGTVTHLVMEKLDFSFTDSEDDICFQVDELVRRGFITETQAKYINCANIARIFRSDVGRRLIQNADRVHREFSFKYLMDASAFTPGLKREEKIVIQGMIDIYFEDEHGNIVIADYKTDKVKNVEDIRKRYAPQLKYYKIALEKALGKSVDKTYLLLLDTGEAVEC